MKTEESILIARAGGNPAIASEQEILVFGALDVPSVGKSAEWAFSGFPGDLLRPVRLRVLAGQFSPSTDPSAGLTLEAVELDETLR